MRKQQHPQWKALGKQAMIGVGLALAVALAGCMVSAALLSTGSVQEDRQELLVLASLLLATMTGAWAAVRGENHRLLEGAAFALGWFLTLLSLGAALFDGGVKRMGVTALVCLGISTAVGILKKGRSKGYKKGRKGRKIRRFVQYAQ